MDVDERPLDLNRPAQPPVDGPVAGDAAVMALRKEIDQSAGALVQTRYEIRARDTAISMLQGEISVRDATIATLREEVRSRDRAIADLRARVSKIYGSKLWQTASAYWKLRRQLAHGLTGPAEERYTRRAMVWISRARRRVDDAIGIPGHLDDADTAPSELRSDLSLQVVDAENPPSLAGDLVRFATAYEARFGSAPVILDWTPDRAASACLPPGVAFSPPSDDETLPYLDRSVDVVAVHADDAGRLEEARRVAERCLLLVQEAPSQNGRAGGEPTEQICQVEWLADSGAAPLPSVSIVIPVFNKAELTAACLDALLPTLPAEPPVSVIVVDDASTDETPSLLRDRSAHDPRIRVETHAENQGFVDACNRGAAVADGEIVVFLNNDTLPQQGWLEPLLRLFRDDPQVGVAGSKLLFGDGRLQEAGGVIFKDGTGWNFGRNEADPNAPLFTFVRQVDYCSGAAFATRRDLFQELDGFDTRYRPAYYEDVDYCFSVRQRGFRVLYQPESVVIHLEGGTGGTDLSGGAKKYQEVNRHTLVEKWRTLLAEQPDPPEKPNRAGFQKLVAPAGTKRILIGAPLVPEFDREGGSRRLFHLIEYLLATGWSVTFLAPQGPRTNRYKRILEQRGVAVYLKGDMALEDPTYPTEAERLIATGDFDVAVLAFWNLAEQYIPHFRRLSPRTRIVVDSIDLHFVRQARGTFNQHDVGLRRKLLDTYYADSMIRELNVYAEADQVLTVTQKEADYVCDLTGDVRKARSVPLTDDMPPSSVPLEQRKGILFLGNFRHPPNVEALEYLCREIVPRIDERLLAEHPIWVVGTGLDDRIRAIGQRHPHVKMIGWVPTTAPYLHAVRMTAVPLLHGAGMKSKLVQALMAATPTVTTTIGVEGMDLVDGEHVLIGDSPRRFADGITRVLTDDALWHQLADRGREQIMARFSSPVIERLFFEAIDDVMHDEPDPVTLVIGH